MKQKLSILILLCFSFFLNAQRTNIPDVNFEKALISLGYDDTEDGSVLTENIDGILILTISSKGISNLNGIEDFTALTELNCQDNSLNTLDISKNINLTKLFCHSNQLTNLDISKNINLKNFSCHTNKLTVLDLSKNVKLEDISCDSNQLTSLDLSEKPLLKNIRCTMNQLTSLNLSNSPLIHEIYCDINKLENLDVSSIDSLTILRCRSNNTTLTCIKLNPSQYASINSAGTISGWFTDRSVSYSLDCEQLSVEEDKLNASLAIYPNPFSIKIAIKTTENIQKVVFYSAIGVQVLVVNNTFDAISTKSLAKGIYFVRIASDKASVFRKIIKN